jgi:hypothetical protein
MSYLRRPRKDGTAKPPSPPLSPDNLGRGFRQIPDAPAAFIEPSFARLKIIVPSIIRVRSTFSDKLDALVNFGFDLPFRAGAGRLMQMNRDGVVVIIRHVNAGVFHRFLSYFIGKVS